MSCSTLRAAGSLLLLAALAASEVGCLEIESFGCGADDACARQGTAGRCEPQGVCAYPSEVCPSRWRYSPNAGSLADACVPESPVIVETDSSGASSSGSNSSGASSSGGGPQSESSTEVSSEPSCAGCQPATANGRTFFVCATARTWFAARDACSACDLELASIQDEAENVALADRVPAPTQLWLGFSDVELEGDWQWEDGSAMDFEAWAEGEPSTLTEDDCGLMTSSGEWFAKRCDLPNPFACVAP